VDEEVVLLEEQLAAAHAEVERLTLRLADAEALAATRAEEVERLGRDLGEREARLEAQSQEGDALRSALERATEQAGAAAQRYREAALAREPDLPADLIAGDSVEAIDAALARARETVAQVRQHLEQQAQAQRVPPGAPVRGAPDLSDLSAAEKIRLGLQQT
jgi:hypothetical protein